jgi:hypothetical protein
MLLPFFLLLIGHRCRPRTRALSMRLCCVPRAAPFALSPSNLFYALVPGSKFLLASTNQPIQREYCMSRAAVLRNEFGEQPCRARGRDGRGSWLLNGCGGWCHPLLPLHAQRLASVCGEDHHGEAGEGAVMPVGPVQTPLLLQELALSGASAIDRWLQR